MPKTYGSCTQQVDTLSSPPNTCRHSLQNPFLHSKNLHAIHTQAAHLKRNCLLEISCSLRISAFIKHDLTGKTKWKSISCNSELWLWCNGFIMSEMMNAANCRLPLKQLPNTRLYCCSSLLSMCWGHPTCRAAPGWCSWRWSPFLSLVCCVAVAN